MRPWPLAALILLAMQTPALSQESVTAGTGVVLRGLDKANGDVVDMALANGETAKLGRLSVELQECRYPRGAASESFAYLTVHDASVQEPIFEGWMIASSPALNALEHPRYDVWVLRCKTD